MTNHSLKDKVVVIGGGAKNLGGLIARSLAEGGASAITVHYNSDSTRAAADETVAAVKALGGDAVAIQGDLSKPSVVAKLLGMSR